MTQTPDKAFILTDGPEWVKALSSLLVGRTVVSVSAAAAPWDERIILTLDDGKTYQLRAIGYEADGIEIEEV